MAFVRHLIHANVANMELSAAASKHAQAEARDKKAAQLWSISAS